MSKILLPGFRYQCATLIGGRVVDQFEARNLVPQAGVDYFAKTVDGTGTVVANWYLGLFKNDFVPVNSTTAADLPSTVGEFTGYDETVRPTWAGVYDDIGSIDNLASPAEFTINQDVTLYGVFLVSAPTKAGSSGTLLSIARFPSPKELEAGSVFRIKGGLSIVAE